MNTPTNLPSTGCPLELWDGSYVLGSLSPADRREFEAHLDGCDTCSRSVRDLAGLPGLLGRIGPEVFDDAEQPEPLPETLLPRLSRAVRREQRRRTWLTAAAAAAAAVAITAGGVAVYDHSSSPTTTTTSSSQSTTWHPMTSVADDPMTASVALTPVAWGTRLELTCSYSRLRRGGATRAQHATYALVVHTVDGRQERVATFRGLPDRVMHLSGSTAASVSQISWVDVTWADGTPVLELSL